MLLEQLHVDEVDSSIVATVRISFARDFWVRLWPKIKDHRIKVTVLIFPISVAVEKLKPVFEWVFGPEPTTSSFTE